MAIPIERGENFYCQSFAYLSVKNIPDEIRLRPNVWFGKGLAVMPGDYWKRWLGELAFDRLQSSFVLTATGPQPRKGDFVNKDLNRALDHLTFGLVLQGVPDYRESFFFAGANESGIPEVRHFVAARVFCPSREMRPLVIGHAELERAVRIADGLAAIDHQGEDWRRLRRGIDALMTGSAEQRYSEFRLHDFVRSLEALILPREGRTKRDFIHRSQTFAFANEATRTTLGQIYDVRSQVEHLNNALECLPGADAKAKEALLYARTRQADSLARFCLARVIEDGQLADIFKTDAEIAAFWAKPDDERRRLWGTRFDLQAAT